MRLSNKTFGQRTPFFTEKQEPKSKYILVYEGEETEVQYFDGILENKDEIGISKLIEIKPILRSYREKSYSHPLRILEFLGEYLIHNLTDGISVKSFINCMIDYLICELEISDNSIYSPKIIETDIQNYFSINLGLQPDSIIINVSSAINEIANHLKQKINLYENIDRIQAYIENQQIVFNQEIDKVCIIVDRDYRNFKENQYDYVVKKCQELNYKLYISNPCFEFWLLLHSSDVNTIDTEKLLKNKKVTSKKRFTEIELSRIFSGYKKNDIKFDRFKPNIQLAISQGKDFCEDVVGLKTRLGTNIGLLLEEMISFSV